MYIDEEVKKYADQLSANLAKSINKLIRRNKDYWNHLHEVKFRNDGRKYCVRCGVIQ
jgi:hypothetical protein